MKVAPQFLVSRFLILKAGIFPLILLPLAPLSAQTVWIGSGTTLNWSEAANWSAGVPTAGVQTRFLNGTLPDTPITVTVDTVTPIDDLNMATNGNRSVTLNGGTLNLETAGSTIAWNSSFGGTTGLTLDSDVNFSNSVDGDAATFQLNLVGRPLTFNGDITTSGSGGRAIQMLGNGTVTINGSNAADYLRLGNTGEVIANSTSAFGSGNVYKTGTGILSLRSDVTVTGAGKSYAWNQYATTSGIRISELASSAADRTLTLEDRTTGNGALQFLDNINSSGNLILELKYSGVTVQTIDFATNATGIIRFAQTADTTYSRVISGAGQLEKNGGAGTTTLTGVNTYTGKTTISTGTLLLSGTGSISASSEINVASGATFSVADITGGSYTLESGQTLSGEGSVVTGGKDLILNGTLAPGSSPGTLTVDLDAGIFSLGSDTDLQFELGTSSDLVNLTSATGTLDIGSGTLDFGDFSFTDGAGFGIGQYTLFQNAGLKTGSLGTTTGLVGGLNGELMFSGNNLILDVSVVPEPGTASLLLGGLALALLGRRNCHLRRSC